MKRPEWTRYRVRLVLDEFRWKLPVAAAFLGTEPDALLDLVLADARWRRLPSGRTTPLHPDTISTPELRELLVLHAWNYSAAARALHVPPEDVRRRSIALGVHRDYLAAHSARVAALHSAAVEALNASGGSYGKAARLLGICKRSLKARLRNATYTGRRVPRRRAKLVPNAAAILAALRSCNGDRTAASVRLCIRMSTLMQRLRGMRADGVRIPEPPRRHISSRILPTLEECQWSRQLAAARLGCDVSLVWQAVRRLRAKGVSIPNDPEQGRPLARVRRLPSLPTSTPAKAA